MGQVTEICTGKTATLTQNRMQVNMFFTGGRLIHNQKPNTFNRSEIAEMNSILIKESIVYNCTARIEMSNDALYVPTGNGTESGLLSFL
jgi:magnesium-transporting ATPase (P-type)